MPIYVVENPELIKKTEEHFRAVKRVMKAARDFAKTIPNVDQIYTQDSHHFGGLAGVTFKKEIPEGFMRVHRGTSARRPNSKTNKELYNKWYSLPIVKHTELNKIYDFKGYESTSGPFKICTHIGIRKVGKTYVISTFDYVHEKWIRPAGVREITHTELQELESSDKKE
jgi:hypothetical protein